MTDTFDDQDTPSALDPTLLDRYLAGECSTEEEARVRRAYGGQDPAPALRRALTDAASTGTWDAARAWSSVRSRMGSDTEDQETGRRPQRVAQGGRWNVTASSRRMLVAASVILVAGAVVVTREAGRPTAGEVPTLAQVEIATGVGERRDITLPDSSVVTLAPRSRLVYPSRFETVARDVQLNGHAFFKVSKDATRPFTVHANGATVRVLGTEFDVREDSSAREVVVVVESGRVRLQDASGAAREDVPVLTANHRGRLQLTTGALAVDTGVVVDQFLGWRDDRLRFEATPLQDVVNELARWYDVDFALTPAVARRSVSADVRVDPRNGESLGRILDALSVSLDLTFVRSGRTITVAAR